MAHALDVIVATMLSSYVAAGEPAADGYRDLRRSPDAVTATTETGAVDLLCGANGDWSGAAFT